MKINLQIDSAPLLLRLRNGERRLAYAAVNAINATVKRIQKAERQRIEDEFTVRKKTFVLRQAAIIKPFASVGQGRPYAEVSVGQKPRLLLSAFERGGERKPATQGARRVAEPVVGGPARPRFTQPVPTELRVRRLRFDKTKAGKVRAAAKRTRTYLVPDVGIFQRTGPEASRLVYFFSKGKMVRPRLRFIKTAKSITDRWFKEELEREVIKAISRQ
jgi:hypothetical protein